MRSPVMCLPAVLLLAVGVAGCGPVHEEDVRGTATAFYEAYASDDGAGACDRLAPRTKSELEESAGKPCSEAVLEEDVPEVDEPQEIRVFGTQAEVKWSGETTFLARFQDGWKVMAAACKNRPHKPYDCTISGG